MEPVTHILTGACLARTGLNRRAAYATAAMAIAAEFPDIDTVWSLRGPLSGFEHHRGITHTFLGLPFEAAVLLLAFYGYDRWRSRRSPPQDAESSRSHRTVQTEAPVSWGTLYFLMILALLSHLLLDFTNNYGLRPFLPFHDQWYAGSLVFIFDPLIFLLLVAGLALPALFGLIGREVGARRETFRGRGWACAALAGVVLIWGVRWVEHGRAVALAQDQTLRAPAEPTLTAQPLSAEALGPASRADAETAPADARPLLIAARSLASPDPLSVFRWYTVTDFGPAYRTGVADTRLGTLAAADLFVKPESSPELVAAEQSRLGRLYLDWSPMPIVRLTSGGSNVPDISTDSSVAAVATFIDPRFLGDTPLLQRQKRPPLTGEVFLGPDRSVIAEGIDGRYGR